MGPLYTIIADGLLESSLVPLLDLPKKPEGACSGEMGISPKNDRQYFLLGRA
jgi:hypothetical protein